MLDEETLFRDLGDIGLPGWRDALSPLIRERFADRSHGDLATWKEVVAKLPAATGDARLSNENATDTDAVVISTGTQSPEQADRNRDLLLQLKPWRKGPFRIDGIELDSEWRSHLKWDRIRNAIQPLDGRNVLDVGCGNGYYALRMRLAGASRVIGIDPTLLFVCQFLALKKMSGASRVHVLPLRLQDLPKNARAFDTTFSMGVLSHQRDPLEHLVQLRDTLRPGGELVLETLVVPGEELRPLVPEDRYARMRNVWCLPTVPLLGSWLRDAGFRTQSIADIATTTVNEQRSTAWMPFESLAEALDPRDASLTVEGLPAPTRVVLICQANETP